VIVCANPQAQYASHKEEIDQAIQRALLGAHYILGPEVAKFEKTFAAYTGVDYAVGLNSGTDALILGLRALGVEPGDEVITVSMTALATVSAILAVGATPVLVDIDPIHYTIDPAAVRKVISNKTKAIVAVHLYGQAADLESLMAIAKENGLPLIEDCAQSTGARYKGRRLGSLGDLGCFSFYPTKNLGAIGDGGMLVTQRPEIAERVRRLRQYGWDDTRATVEPGLNSRLDEVQAAILNVKLQHLDADNSRRRAIAKTYSEALGGLRMQLPAERPETEHVFHLYVLKLSDREKLKSHLASHGVLAGVHYPVPAHRHGGYTEKCVLRAGPLAVTDQLSATVLSLPMYPELTVDEVNQVVRAVKSFY
jgi:dTDP-4-amino-4,6-dideoxygalactose transaminase